jgi:phosphatidylglycerophosphate synthase
MKEKMSHHPGINWRQHRKMILQFWAISILHLGLWLPLISVSLIQMTVNPSFMADQYTNLEYTLYYMPLLLPIVCLCAIPDLVKKIIGFIWKRRTNVVSVDAFPLTKQRPPNITVQ